MFATAPAPVQASRQVDRAVLQDINQIRSQNGLGVVSENRRMDNGAKAHSRTMARTRTLSHGAFSRRVRRYARSSTIGEIIGYTAGYGRSQAVSTVVRAWMQSGEHRAIMLSGAFHRAGVGVARKGSRVFFTVDFAA